MDRAAAFEAEGWGFESLRRRSLLKTALKNARLRDWEKYKRGVFTYIPLILLFQDYIPKKLIFNCNT